MNRKDLVNKIYEMVNEELLSENEVKKIKLTKGRIDIIVDATFKAITEVLETTDENITIPSFGVFSKKVSKGRKGRCCLPTIDDEKIWTTEDSYRPSLKFSSVVSKKVKTNKPSV